MSHLNGLTDPDGFRKFYVSISVFLKYTKKGCKHTNNKCIQTNLDNVVYQVIFLKIIYNVEYFTTNKRWRITFI